MVCAVEMSFEIHLAQVADGCLFDFWVRTGLQKLFLKQKSVSLLQISITFQRVGHGSITEVKLGENELTSYPDCGAEEGYQLPEHGHQERVVDSL